MSDDNLMAWALAEIRQIVGVNEKPMLSELPDAVRAAFDQQDATIKELRGLLEWVYKDGFSVVSGTWIAAVEAALARSVGDE